MGGEETCTGKEVKDKNSNGEGYEGVKRTKEPQLCGWESSYSVQTELGRWK